MGKELYQNLVKYFRCRKDINWLGMSQYKKSNNYYSLKTF